MDDNVENVKDALRLFKILRRIMDKMHKSMSEHFKELNITGTQIMIIMILIHNGKMKISSLSSKMSLSNSTVSGIVDRLEKQELVQRIRSKEDRRVVYVEITPKLEKMDKSKCQKITKNFQSLISSATPEEISTIREGFDTLERVMDRGKSSRE